MAGGAWQLEGSSASVVVSLTKAAPTNAASSGMVVRLRSFQVSLSSTAAGQSRFIIRNGESGVGDSMLREEFRLLVNTAQQVNVSNIDLRASVGNGITVEFLNFLANSTQSISAQGDIVPIGYPQGQN